MKNIWKWILRNIGFVVLAGIGVIKFVNYFLSSSKVENVDSPLPFQKSKADEGEILVIDKDTLVTVKLPDGVKNKNVKAVQINNKENKVQVEVKHEKIPVDNSVNDFDPRDFDI